MTTEDPPGAGMSLGIGASPRRREDLRLLTGQGRYSDDFSAAGRAYAVMVRSPHAHARLNGIDTEAARAVPGVLAVLTGADMVADGLQPIPHAVWSGHPADLFLPNTDGTEAFTPGHFCMATSEARHVGEIVAMVVAETLAAAHDAAELVEPHYGIMPSVARASTAAEAGSVSARDDSV